MWMWAGRVRRLTFNSLYEIRQACQDVRTGRDWILSILSMRFVGAFMARYFSGSMSFQFSLWDSWICSIHPLLEGSLSILSMRFATQGKRSKLKSIKTFNSLYEIHSTMPTANNISSITFNSLYEIRKIMRWSSRGPTLDTFNSLYEIRQDDSADDSVMERLSILSMRFRDRQKAGKNQPRALSILSMRFEVYKAVAKAASGGHFQFSLWDSAIARH